MKSCGLVAVVVVAAVVCGVAPPAFAQQKQGAVLLLPESDMDRELADDLSEVLISALIERSGKEYKLLGKETFRKALTEAPSEEGFPCSTSIECVREVGKKLDLSLLVFGKVGKAMGGFRIEVWKVSLTSAPDRPQYRKHVPGDLSKLIEEVESVANWVLTPDNPYLTITVNVEGAKILVDGKPVEYIGKPVAVAPGTRTVEATKEGHTPAKVTVNCEHQQSCKAELVLKPVAVVKPIEPVKPREDGPKVEERASLMPYVYALAGVSLLAAGGGVFMYTQMMAAEEDLEAKRDELCPGKKCYEEGTSRQELEDAVNPIIDDGETAAVWATIGGVTAAGAAAGAVTLLVFELASGDAPATTSLAPQFAPGFSGAVFETTF